MRARIHCGILFYSEGKDETLLESCLFNVLQCFRSVMINLSRKYIYGFLITLKVKLILGCEHFFLGGSPWYQ